MKKNAKYLALGGTLMCISLALLIVASTTTSGTCTTCNTDDTSMGIESFANQP